ncbi:MAG: DUF3010 family protein [Crocinitomicaceae bacterium]
MKILAIEVMSNATGMLIIDGNQNIFSVKNLGKPLSILKEDTSVKGVLSFQSDFDNYLKSLNIDKVVLCEGGKDSKKMRVRMEFAILSVCEKLRLEYETYPTGSCTRIINSTYLKETGRKFSDDLAINKLPKYMGKILAAGWRFLG